MSLTVPLPGVPPTALFGLPDRPFTVMVVGLDVRPHESGPSRTDSILLLRVDPEKNRTAILSIPRDTMMQIVEPDGDTFRDRINTAYFFSELEAPGSGPNALAQTIERNLGIHVDYHVVFDQRGAARIIDAAGGVTVHNEQAFGQDDYSDDDINVVPQFFPEGELHLDGYQAVAYGRIREGSSDFDRIQRQQRVAEGLLAQLSSPAKALDWWDVYQAYDESVNTDLGMRESAGLFVFLKRIGSERLVTYSLADAAVPCGYCTASIQLLQAEEAARIIAEAFDDPAAGMRAAQLLQQAGVTG
jgi:LCP family protein required for cell wall assembly